MSSSRENEPFEKVESVCRELIASLKVKNKYMDLKDEIMADKLMYNTSPVMMHKLLLLKIKFMVETLEHSI